MTRQLDFQVQKVAVWMLLCVHRPQARDASTVNKGSSIAVSRWSLSVVVEAHLAHSTEAMR